jgi:hypothetical protein
VRDVYYAYVTTELINIEVTIKEMIGGRPTYTTTNRAVNQQTSMSI